MVLSRAAKTFWYLGGSEGGSEGGREGGREGEGKAL